jgi:hypothetical protein
MWSADPIGTATENEKKFGFKQNRQNGKKGFSVMNKKMKSV